MIGCLLLYFLGDNRPAFWSPTDISLLLFLPVNPQDIEMIVVLG